MEEIVTAYSFYSYATASVAYIGLTLFALLLAKKKHLFYEFFFVLLASSLWASHISYDLYTRNPFYISDSLPYETVRNLAVITLLASLLCHYQKYSYTYLFKSKLSIAIALFSVFTFLLDLDNPLLNGTKNFIGQDPRVLVHVIFSILGLVIVEQFYRNIDRERRWNIKFLCIGFGALFTIDFIIYSKSLLFQNVDDSLWSNRGFINTLITPLLFISVHRLERLKSFSIQASRKLVFHTIILFGTGIYLILMSLTGFYIRDYGGSWGNIAQVFFIFLAILLLTVAFVSGKTRAITKFYLAKHFFHYRYDYRDEWIKLSKGIAQLSSTNELSNFIIKTMSELVDSSGGGLWLLNERGDYYLAEYQNLGFQAQPLIKSDASLIEFLHTKQWVIDFVEFMNTPEIYDAVDLSLWCAEEKNVWLIIPLFQQNVMQAFVVLVKAKVPRKLNWEDHDLLKTVGMQLANALALEYASEALAKAKQFEAYNRLSAFLVHDLKNLVAQIALIVKNSDKHKYNPEFIDDSIATLQNVIQKIEHILAQLNKGQVKDNDKIIINLVPLMTDVAIQQSGNQPTVQVNTNQQTKIEILGNPEKLTAILGHLVQNAQEATPDAGTVTLALSQEEAYAIIQVMDTGCGMDEKFIAERLFKPFDTTKGNAGMGIGVYEAQDYIVNHAGTITVTSAVDQGTTFEIKLPLINFDTVTQPD